MRSLRKNVVKERFSRGLTQTSADFIFPEGHDSFLSVKSTDENVRVSLRVSAAKFLFFHLSDIDIINFHVIG